jgi:hypothetical protein
MRGWGASTANGVGWVNRRIVHDRERRPLDAGMGRPPLLTRRIQNLLILVPTVHPHPLLILTFPPSGEGIAHLLHSQTEYSTLWEKESRSGWIQNESVGTFSTHKPSSKPIILVPIVSPHPRPHKPPHPHLPPVGGRNNFTAPDERSPRFGGREVDPVVFIRSGEGGQDSGPGCSCLAFLHSSQTSQISRVTASS